MEESVDFYDMVLEKGEKRGFTSTRMYWREGEGEGFVVNGRLGFTNWMLNLVIVVL